MDIHVVSDLFLNYENANPSQPYLIAINTLLRSSCSLV